MLEVHINTNLHTEGTWIWIAIYATGYFRIKTFVLGNDKWILYSSKYASVEILIPCRERITKRNVAAFQV